MKTISYFSLIVLLVAANACSKKDNYSPPQSQLTGALLYNGDSIYLEYNRVSYQLYQYGFGKLGPIEQQFTQSGTLNSLLFDGEYKFIVPNGQGPFLWPKTAGGAPDSITISMSGSKNLDIDVTPYYLIRNIQITKNGADITATFSIEKIVTDANAKDIESVSLYINPTQFVSGSNYLSPPRIPDNAPVGKTDVSGSSITDFNNVQVSVPVPTSMTPTQDYVFARVGLKIAGIEDMIFSQLVQVSL